MPTEQDWVVVYAGSIAKADLLRVVLDGEGIGSLLKDEVVGSLLPFLCGGGGAVKVMIQKKDLERARPIIESYRDNKDLTD